MAGLREQSGQVDSGARAPARAGFWPTAWRSALVGGLGTLVLTTCVRPTAPTLPAGALPFTPPAVYQQWWSMVESCAGRSAPLSAIRWYVMPGVQSFKRKDMTVAGVWTRADNSIVLGEYVQYNGHLVRHEMLHAVLQNGLHPRQAFLERCGGIVTCLQSCLTDAGPADVHVEQTPLVPPTALEVDFEVAPSDPGVLDHEGWFMFVVKARNPAGYPVIVALPSSAGPLDGRSFVLDVAGPNVTYRRGARAVDASMIHFEAGETKRYVFDFRLTSDVDGTGLPPGSYSVRAGYGDNWTSQRQVLLGP